MAYGSLAIDKITTSDGFTLGGSGATMKNRIINGAMVIDQRNAGSAITAAGFTVDRWYNYVSASSKASVGRSTTAPDGFAYSLGVTSSSAYSVTSSDYFMLYQAIEGFNWYDMAWGTASAKSVTLSFWVRSSLTGTFGGSIQNWDQNRSYPFTYTVNSADTWEQKSITIPGDTSGTWVGASTGASAELNFSYGMGSTKSGTAGAWASANYLSATGTTSVVGTNGATFYITGVQLEAGSQATSFDYKHYTTDLQLCQRYCYVIKPPSGEAAFAGGSNYSTSQINYSLPVPVPMRTTPSATVSSSWLNTYQAATGQTSSSSPSVGEYGVGSYRIFVGGLSGLTAGYSSWAIVTSGSSFILSAEF